MPNYTPLPIIERHARTTNFFDEDRSRLLARARSSGRGWYVGFYGPDERLVDYSEWATREAAENVARKYAESVA